MEQITPDIRAGLLEAEALSLESLFTNPPSDALDAIGGLAVKLFDLLAEKRLSLVKSKSDVDAYCEDLGRAVDELTQGLAQKKQTKSVPQKARKALVRLVAMRLEGRQMYWMAQASKQCLGAKPQPISGTELVDWTDPKSLPRQLKAARLRAHHTQQNAAEAIGVEVRTYRRYELGEQIPKRDGNVTRVENYLKEHGQVD
jgi:predicted trehalose synthase